MNHMGRALIVWRQARQGDDGHWTEDSERWCIRGEYEAAHSLYERLVEAEPTAEWEWMPDDEWVDVAAASESMSSWLDSARAK